MKAIEPAYRFSRVQLCEDCQVDEWVRLDIKGNPPYAERIKGKPARRRGKIPSDNATTEFLSNWYSKN